MMPRSTAQTLRECSPIAKRVALLCYALADEWGEVRGLDRHRNLVDLVRPEIARALAELVLLGLAKVEHEGRARVVTLLEWREPKVTS